jgi:hypothetical protein
MTGSGRHAVSLRTCSDVSRPLRRLGPMLNRRLLDAAMAAVARAAIRDRATPDAPWRNGWGSVLWRKLGWSNLAVGTHGWG